jgi:hypothetical protein
MTESESVSPAKPRIEWDRITALMAVLIGACALAVSLYTAYLQNAQVRAQTWPHIQLWQSNVDRSFSISNRGVGPARIADVRLRIDGLEVTGFDQAIKKLQAKPEPVSSLQSYFARRVLTPNEDVKMIQFETDAHFNIFMNNRDRIRFEICYCSVLNECYLLNENAKTEAQYITSTPRCPLDKPGQFR